MLQVLTKCDFSNIMLLGKCFGVQSFRTFYILHYNWCNWLVNKLTYYYSITNEISRNKLLTILSIQPFPSSVDIPSIKWNFVLAIVTTFPPLRFPRWPHLKAFEHPAGCFAKDKSISRVNGSEGIASKAVERLTTRTTVYKTV